MRLHVGPEAAVRRVMYATESTSLSGGSRQILNNVLGLTAGGVPVLLAAKGDTDLTRAARDAGAEVVDWDGSRWWSAASRLTAIAVARQVDVVHAFHTAAVKAAVLARVLGMPARVFLNRGVVTSGNPLWGAFVRLTDGAICNSVAAADSLAARGASRRRLHVVYNSTVAALHAPNGGVSSGVGSGGQPPSAIGGPEQVVWVGNANAAKGIDDYEAAAALVNATRRPGCRFVAVGVGPAADPLVDIVPSGRVERLGRLSHERVLDVLRESDLFVLTSRRRESLPNVVLEAFLAGLPVVATDVGGVREMIRSGENGWLCRPGDPGDITRAVVTALDAPLLRERAGRRNRAFASERFSNERKAASLLRVYGGAHVVEPLPVHWLEATPVHEHPISGRAGPIREGDR